MKRLVSLLVLVLLLVNSCVLVTATDACSISANDVSVKAGGRFDVNLNVYGNKGLAALSLAVEYDSMDIELIDVVNGEVFEDSALSTSSDKDENPYKINWVDIDLNGANTDGKLATLQFKASEDSLTTTTSVKLSVVQAFDSDMNDVSIYTQDVNVKIDGGNKKVKGIELTSPEKTLYKVNESLDVTGMKVEALYSDNTKADVTDKASIKGFDSSVAGTKLVVVSYKDFSSAFKTEIESSGDMLYIESKEVKAVAGELIELPVEIMNNPGITGVEAKFSFDENLFSVNNISNGDVFESSHMTVGSNSKKVLWNDSKAKTNHSENGTLGVIEVKVNETVEIGAYPVKLDLCKVVDCDLNTVNAYDNELFIKVYGRKYLFADANGDGKSNVKDASLIQKYIAGAKVDIDKDASDCDADGIISILDATKIQKLITESITDESYETFIYI